MAHLELHRHSKASLLDGAGSGEQWAARAAELQMPALALTDHGVLSGILEHISGCRNHSVIPVLGIEAYFQDTRLVHEKEYLKKYHLTLLAMSLRGWRSLVRLSTESFDSKSFYQKPTIDPELMARHSEDVYCLAGCGIAGRFAAYTELGDEAGAKNFLALLHSIYGDRVALEIQPHALALQTRVNLATWRISHETSTPMVVTGDAHDPTIEWSETRDVRIMAATKQTNLKRKAKLEEGGEIFHMQQEHPTLHLMSREEKAHAFAQFHPNMDARVVEAALDHSGEIVSQFTPFLFDRDVKMPRITRRVLKKIDEPAWAAVEENSHDADWWDEQHDDLVRETLWRWSQEGLAALQQLYPADHWEKFSFQSYQDRLAYEFSVFDQIGPHVHRYLVMAAGEIRWAKRNDIAVGPSRGSSAASLVCYCTEITAIDPISYQMIFERFINPGRRGMPDVDIDFMPGQKGRNKVISHTASVYGQDNVFDVATYAEYGPRSAIRAVCRIHDDEVDYMVGDECSKALDVLDSTEKPDLEECAERFEVIANFKRDYPTLWRHATRLEGHPYAFSRHASAVMVKPAGIEIPLASRSDKETGERTTVTAWPDTHELLADYGFLKLDYLVIDGLIRQHEILVALRDRENSPIDLSTLPVRWNPYATDPAVMEKFAQGATEGVWQMDRAAVPVLKAVRPENMLDLAAVNALIRPGPRGAGMTDAYARRKNGQEQVTYYHDSLEQVLDWTLGLVFYHENVMQIAMTLADFTATEADELRKAMGKKYREGMAAVKKFLKDLGYREKFVHAASSRVGEESATDIWDNVILKFGGYGFPFPHAAGYGLISYHDMLLKTEAPADFYAWLLTTTDTKDMADRLRSSMREGRRFGVSVTPPSVNLSDLAFRVTDRQTILYGLEAVKGVGAVGAKAIFENRPYSSYADFDMRVPKRNVNKNAREALVGAGAFDEFGMRDDWPENKRIDNELAYVGVRLTGTTDLDRHQTFLDSILYTEPEYDAAKDGETLCVGGEIVNVKTAKNRDDMGFVTCAYGSSSYRVTVFPGQWGFHSDKFVVGQTVFFEGHKQESDKYGPSLIADAVTTLDELLFQHGQPSEPAEPPVSSPAPNPFVGV